MTAFEMTHLDFINYALLIKKASMSRIMFDLYVEEAKLEGLIIQDSDKDLRLTEKGKYYAIQHKLIR
ncbi:hypothetical protein D3C78_1712780 [compost metagenome]